MIKYLLFTATLILSWSSLIGQQKSDILMTVAGQPVTVEEFQYIYEKNNGNSADYSQRSIKEYLDLYTKFKLKVAKAKALKMDTIQSLNEELDGYKRQLANSYLMDKEVLSFLEKQLFERMGSDIKISHIYTNVNKKSSPFEKEKALSKIQEAKSKLNNGQSFEEVAKLFSEDKNTAENGGTLGYFTAMMPNGYYELENAMYDTKVGEISNVIQTKIGYHIIKVEEKRPARGKINIAHILVKKTNPKAKEIIENAYNELEGGTSFDEVLLKYTEDNKTKNVNGMLPEMGINTYEKTFEDAAFALEMDGDFSKPVETKIGYHIIKRISKPKALDFNTFKKVYEPKIKKDERYEVARTNLIEDIKKSGGYTKNEKLFNQFAALLDDTFLTYKWEGVKMENGNESLLSFGRNASYSLNDFIAFCKKNTRTRLKYDKTATTPAEVAAILYDQYLDEKAIDFEQSNLEVKYADFRSLMREYEEGILLFEVTKDAVWDKANEDSIGLQAYYEKHKNKYMTEDQADLQMIFINTEDKNLAEKVKKYYNRKGLKKSKKKFNKKSEVVTDFTEKLDRSKNQFGGIEWADGATSDLEFDEKANRYTFKKILETYKPSIKPLKDARGYIVADYQDYLEREWIKSLKEEFKTEVNQEVVNSLIK